MYDLDYLSLYNMVYACCVYTSICKLAVSTVFVVTAATRLRYLDVDCTGILTNIACERAAVFLRGYRGVRCAM